MAAIKYLGKVLEDGHITLPPGAKKKLGLKQGEKIEVTLKQIVNPLYELVGLCKQGKEDASVKHDEYLYQGD